MNERDSSSDSASTSDNVLRPVRDRQTQVKLKSPPDDCHMLLMSLENNAHRIPEQFHQSQRGSNLILKFYFQLMSLFESTNLFRSYIETRAGLGKQSDCMHKASSKKQMTSLVCCDRPLGWGGCICRVFFVYECVCQGLWERSQLQRSGSHFLRISVSPPHLSPHLPSLLFSPFSASLGPTCARSYQWGESRRGIDSPPKSARSSLCSPSHLRLTGIQL